VPSLAAGVVASLAGWLIGSLLDPYFGTGMVLFLSLVFSTVLYFVTRNWLIRLRGR
jgi:hypothetical protein